jgi:hypothetical protein
VPLQAFLVTWQVHSGLTEDTRTPWEITIGSSLSPKTGGVVCTVQIISITLKDRRLAVITVAVHGGITRIKLYLLHAFSFSNDLDVEYRVTPCLMFFYIGL